MEKGTYKKIRNSAILLIFLLAIFFYPYGKPAPIHYIERETGRNKIEQVPGEFWLYWLYHNPVGELSLEALVKRKVVSSFYGRLMETSFSAKEIMPFVRKYKVNLQICQKQKFKTFNDFFTRKLKPEARPIDTLSNVVVSPADGKILVWQNIGNRDFIVKGYRFNLKSFLLNDSLVAKYKNGSLLLFRLCPTDYHRFHFPVNGKIVASAKIAGAYYSVSPIAIRQKIRIFCENKREYTLIKTKQFDEVLMSEIGATMVGSIIQTYQGKEAVKGSEKGYFKFGGSSVILLFQPHCITIDKDLLKNTQNHLETTVKFGERVATAMRPPVE